MRVPWIHVAVIIAVIAVGTALLLIAGGGINDGVAAVGASLISVGAVTIMYDYYFVQRKLVSFFSILTNAREIELRSLYVTRKEARQAIFEELEQARGEVKISCVCGSDFFQGEGAEILSSLACQNRRVVFRFLLLDHECNNAVLRAWLEEEYGDRIESLDTLDTKLLSPPTSVKAWFPDSRLRQLGQLAERSVAKLDDPSCETRFLARFYGYQPSLFFVAVNKSIFMEPYHFGAGPFHESKGLLPSLGKRVLVMRFRRDSRQGMIFENHFDRLWCCSRVRREIGQHEQKPAEPDIDVKQQVGTIPVSQGETHEFAATSSEE